MALTRRRRALAALLSIVAATVVGTATVTQAAPPPAFFNDPEPLTDLSTTPTGAAAPGRIDPASLVSSPDGRTVVFAYGTDDLSGGGDASRRTRLYARDVTGTAARVVNVSADGTAVPGRPRAIGFADDHTLVFETIDAQGLRTYYRKDLDSGALSTPYGPLHSTATRFLSADGRYLVLSATDALGIGGPGAVNVYVLDVRSGALYLASAAPDGRPLTTRNTPSAVSADGTKVAFTTSDPAFAPHRQRVLVVKDLRTHAVTVASPLAASAPYPRTDPAVSRPVFTHGDTHLVFSFPSNGVVAPGRDAQVFEKDLVGGALVVRSTTAAGASVNAAVTRFAVAADDLLVFDTSATNVLGGTGPGGNHVYKKNAVSGQLLEVSATRYETPLSSDPPSEQTRLVGVSPNGRYALMTTTNADLLGQAVRDPLIMSDLADGVLYVMSIPTAPNTMTVSGSATAGFVGDAAAGVGYVGFLSPYDATGHRQGSAQLLLKAMPDPGA